MDWWRSLRHKLELLRQLSLRDWLTLVQAWWALFAFHLALHWVSLERLEDFIRAASKREPVPPDALVWARQRQKLVSQAARLHLLSMTCLPRAFTLHWMLSKLAIPSQLCIGMQKTYQGMYAHAWVVVEGEPIGEPEDINERFMILQGAG